MKSDLGSPLRAEPAASGPGKTTPAIVLTGVGKTFDSATRGPSTIKESILGSLGRRGGAEALQALVEVDLSVERGETLGIVGANGSGKSTLLKIIAGITPPSEGEVHVNGRILGLIELGAGFHLQLSGEENVKLQGAIHGLSGRRVGELLDPIFDYAELQDFRASALKHYSSGMIVRLGFAIAIHCEPEILLLDEVLSVGDQTFQEKSLATIAELRGNGVTIVFVTHQMEFAERVCDRIVWLKRGRVYRSGPAAELLHIYHRESIAELYCESEGELTDERIEFGLPGRFGLGGARIVDVRTVDAEGRLAWSFRPGEPFAIEIDYECDRESEAIDCSITLDFEDGVSVAFWRAEPAGGLQRPRSGRGAFRLFFPSPPFLPGRYTLSLAISRPGGAGEHFDLHLRLHRFSIVAEKADLAIHSPVELSGLARWI